MSIDVSGATTLTGLVIRSAAEIDGSTMLGRFSFINNNILCTSLFFFIADVAFGCPPPLNFFIIGSTLTRALEDRAVMNIFSVILTTEKTASQPVSSISFLVIYAR